MSGALRVDILGRADWKNVEMGRMRTYTGHVVVRHAPLVLRCVFLTLLYTH